MVCTVAQAEIAEPLNCDWSMDDKVWGHATGPGFTESLCRAHGSLSCAAFLIVALGTLVVVVMYANLQVMNHDEMAFFIWKDAALMFVLPYFTLALGVLLTGAAVRIRVRANYNSSAITAYLIMSAVVVLSIGCVARKLGRDVHEMRQSRLETHNKIRDWAFNDKEVEMREMAEVSEEKIGSDEDVEESHLENLHQRVSGLFTVDNVFYRGGS